MRLPRWALLAWPAVAVTLLWFAREAPARLQVSADEAGDAAWVERTLATSFGSPFATWAVLVADGLDARDSVARLTLRGVADSLRASPRVASVLSYLDVRDSMFLARDGTFLIVGFRAGAPARDAIVDLRTRTQALEPPMRARHPALTLWWTGAPAIDHDVRRTSADDAATAERRVLPVTLVMLLVVFGSAIAALLPIGAGALSIGLSLGAAALVARFFPLTILLQNIVSMIGLGLGIDYALLIVSRFREALAEGEDRLAAAAEAARTAGKTVRTSALAVAVGFAALLTIPATELRSIGVGGLLVVTASVLIATTLIPWVLAWLGPRVDLLSVRRVARGEVDRGKRWRALGRIVVAHPWLSLLLAGAPLVVLAFQATRLRPTIPDGVWLPSRMESTRGAAALQRMGRSGLVQTIRIIVELPRGAEVTTDSGWKGIARLTRALSLDPRVARARSLPRDMLSERPNMMLLSMLPAGARAGYMSRDERLALVEVVPAERAGAAELVKFVRELRKLDPQRALMITGARLRVGGLPAFNADYEDAVAGSSTRVVLLVVVGTLFALFVAFRSVLVPVKAVLLNLLSVGAAMGATVLVFQDGHGATLFGMDGPIDALFPAIPILVFAIVFGLSMDYEIFLVDRVREGVQAGLSDDDALIEGLSRTGGVITSAALVMIAVFAVFAFGDFLIIKILGFALAVAVAIDATLVRMVVGPALLRLAGRWNWWPGQRMSRTSRPTARR